MAARSPTSFSAVDANKLIARKAVLEATPDAVIDNQHFILDKSELVLSDAFVPCAIQGTRNTWLTIATYWVTFPDLCGAAATKAAWYTVRMSAVDTLWEIRIYNNALALGFQFTSAASSWKWCGNSGVPGFTDMTLASDGTENELLLQVQCPTGNAGTYLNVIGLGIFT